MAAEGLQQVKGCSVVAVAQTKLSLLVTSNTIYTTLPYKYTKPEINMGTNSCGYHWSVTQKPYTLYSIFFIILHVQTIV